MAMDDTSGATSPLRAQISVMRRIIKTIQDSQDALCNDLSQIQMDIRSITANHVSLCRRVAACEKNTIAEA